jgi:CO dehydrogenase/acetyl-CoA synthase beta subunit
MTGNKKDGIIAQRTICEHPMQKKKEEEEEEEEEGEEEEEEQEIQEEEEIKKRWSRRVLYMRQWNG